jgi:hypothetical protein
MIKATCAIILKRNTFPVRQQGAGPGHPLKWGFTGGEIKFLEEYPGE